VKQCGNYFLMLSDCTVLVFEAARMNLVEVLRKE